MTTRGVEFLEAWIVKNVAALGLSDEPMRATNLAMRCIADAAAAGLTLEEIQPETGSVESHIADAMMRPADPGIPNK